MSRYVYSFPGSSLFSNGYLWQAMGRLTPEDVRMNFPSRVALAHLLRRTPSSDSCSGYVSPVLDGPLANSVLSALNVAYAMC